MKSNDVRKEFVKYFESLGHEHVSSSSLVPKNDPTLLFNNAGMNQFKNTFLGLEKRDYNKAVTTQKCVRAGGKHNDLENVGQTARHHTFFEMLGNFSFGDYFKKEALHYSWKFLTQDLGIDKNRLYITVFEDDDETADLWHKQEGIPKDRIYRFGEKDNFWRMGDTGPCGPCSEIFIDLGDQVPGNPKDNVMGGEGDRFMEIWNLVFMQYNENADGTKTPLPKPSVDTGMGLERLTSVLQGEISNYHSDLFMDLINKAAGITGVSYDKNPKVNVEQNDINIALRVLADHARASSFLIADGVLPSNDGRGYVLRRILRRAIRFGRKLDEKSVLPSVAETVIEKMHEFYPELKAQENLLIKTIKDEEQRFLQTLDQGTQILNESLGQLSKNGEKILPGETAFKLYDTYGFPVDLTRLMAEEKGFGVDETGFSKNMEAARAKAKTSWKGKTIAGDEAHLVTFSQEIHKIYGETEFLGYETTHFGEGKILALSNGSRTVNDLSGDSSGILISDKTPFYAEGGGQVGDVGTITTPSGSAEVLDCTKKNDVFLHHIKVTDGSIKNGEPCGLQVTDLSRRSTANNHSATHLLHSALRQVLGEHVQQAGSLVDPQRLRFDFTHNQSLTFDEVQKIENLVNEQISLAIPVTSKLTSHKKAIEEDGALALFGEKYGDEVRVIKMGNYSTELCGGTHVANTAMIRLLVIVSESGVSSGVRRIEALTGELAFQYLMKHTEDNVRSRSLVGIQENWAQFLEESKGTVAQQIEGLQGEIRTLRKELQKAKSGNVNIDELINNAKTFSSNGAEAKLVLGDIPMDDRKVLSDLSDKLKDKIQSGIIVILGQGEKSHPLIVTVSKDLIKTFPAGKILKEVAAELGGKGGGRPDFAQGAVPDRSQIQKAFQKASELIL